MLEILGWVTLGAFVGWNFPQPAWTKRLQDKIMSKIKL